MRRISRREYSLADRSETSLAVENQEMCDIVYDSAQVVPAMAGRSSRGAMGWDRVTQMGKRQV